MVERRVSDLEEQERQALRNRVHDATVLGMNTVNLFTNTADADEVDRKVYEYLRQSIGKKTRYGRTYRGEDLGRLLPMERKEMGDERGAKVEKWKLSDEQLDFQKKFKELKKAREALEFLSAIEQQRLMTLQDAWNQLQISYDGLGQELPKSPTRGLAGMDFEEEEKVAQGRLPQGMSPEQARINY